MATIDKTIIGFSYNETIDTLHPDECFSVSYLGRAQITEDSDGTIDVKVLDLWLGVDVPSEWSPYHFRKVATPDTKPRFYKLLAELEQAAIDQHYSPVPVTLPDEVIEAQNPFRDQAWKDLCELLNTI